MFTALGALGLGPDIGDGTTIGPAAPPPRTAADLMGLIAANNGTLFVWTTNVNTMPELQIAKANPATFLVVPVADDPGSYKITIKASPNKLGVPDSGGLGSYAPYIVLGVGAVVLLTLLKR